LTKSWGTLLLITSAKLGTRTLEWLFEAAWDVLVTL